MGTHGVSGGWNGVVGGVGDGLHMRCLPALQRAASASEMRLGRSRRNGYAFG